MVVALTSSPARKCRSAATISATASTRRRSTASASSSSSYQTSTHIEEALYRLTEANLALGLINEAQTAAAVLGHNYPSSTWYKEAFELLQKQGLAPQVNEGSPLAGLSLQG